MLIREGDRRTIHVDISLALPLAGVAGAVNAAAFSAVGFFSANMTGNVSSFSDYVAGGNWLVAVTFAGLVAAFVLGSFLSTLLIGIGRHRAIRGVFAYSIAVEGLLLGAVYMLTRNLWMCMGLHAAWNVTQGFIWDVPVSGFPVHGLVVARLDGPVLLTGGGFGLEASVIAFVCATALGLFYLKKAVDRGHVEPPWWVRRRVAGEAPVPSAVEA